MAAKVTRVFFVSTAYSSLFCYRRCFCFLFRIFSFIFPLFPPEKFDPLHLQFLKNFFIFVLSGRFFLYTFFPPKSDGDSLNNWGTKLSVTEFLLWRPLSIPFSSLLLPDLYIIHRMVWFRPLCRCLLKDIVLTAIQL